MRSLSLICLALLACDPPAGELALCAPESGFGICPLGRVCVEGACVVDLDPGEGIDDRVALDAELEAIWRRFDEGYALFATKPALDWGEALAATRRQLEGLTTRFEASWAISRMVDAIGDGHALAEDLWRCSETGLWGEPYANSGACVVEADDRLVVYRVALASASAFRPGDELLAIDGRPVELLLADLAAQPRCRVGASTAAMRRARLVAGLMHRAATDRVATVARAGERVEIELDVSDDLATWLLCDGRVGPRAPDVHPFGVVTAEMPGEVLYVHFPAFGAVDDSGTFVTQPLIELLRIVFATAASRRGVIIDLRGNGGGAAEVYLSLASWLYDEETPLFACRFKEGADRADLSPPRWMVAVPDSSLHVAAPVAVLVDPLSFSASDFTAMFLQQTGRAVLFGAPSGGGFGNALQIAEGTSWRLTVNDILCADADGRLLEGAPPPVDVAVDYEAVDIAAGRDSVIEAARSWLDGLGRGR